MKREAKWKKYLPLILVGGAIPAIFILSALFKLPMAAETTLVIILALIFASMLCWAIANRHANGSEWWQDDSASGWRGY